MNGNHLSNTADLPPPQVKESHDLCLDPGSLPDLVSVVVVPYPGMHEGDVVTATCLRFEDDNTVVKPITWTKEVGPDDIGKPLVVSLTRGEVVRVEGGHLDLSYSIAYANPAKEKTSSATAAQTLQVIAPQTALLPALRVLDHDGGPIDPPEFPDGLTLRIKAYPGMSIDDDVLCYAASTADNVDSLILYKQVDNSAISNRFVEFHIARQWLLKSEGAVIDLQYQYARVGAAMSGEPFIAAIRKPLYLPMPIIEGIEDEESPIPGQGRLKADGRNIKGVNITIPGDAEIGPNDKRAVHWEGYGVTGKHIAETPTIDGGSLFNIPPEAIPANMDKWVKVFYSVTPEGETASYASYNSLEYKVWIIPVPLHRYSPLQSKQAQDTGGTISLARIPPEGELFTLQTWRYVRQGQRLNARLTDGSTAVPVFDNYLVSNDDIIAGTISTKLDKQMISMLRLGTIGVQVSVIYEEGAETEYDRQSFKLVS